MHVSLAESPSLFLFFIYVFDPGAVKNTWYSNCVDEIHGNGEYMKTQCIIYSFLNAIWHDLFLKGWCKESKVIEKVYSKDATNDNIHGELLISRLLLVAKFLSINSSPAPAQIPSLH